MLRRCFALLALLVMGTEAVPGQTSAVSPRRINYGTESTSFGELVVPQGAGPFPLAVLLHGGCWKATDRKSVV